MPLTGKKIALFVADIYNEFEFWYPFYRMKEAGAEVTVIGPVIDKFESKHGIPAVPDIAAVDADPEAFDALIIPGGYAPDHMRRNPEMVKFTADMHSHNRVVAAICHAGWMLASAGILAEKTVTSFYAIKDDLVNAGATWVDREVVIDGKLISSRTPDDLPAFCKAIISSLGG